MAKTTDYTFEEVTERLHGIYVSDEYNRLMAKRSQTTYLEIIGKSRRELVFSAILAWIFRNPDFDKTNFDNPTLQKLGIVSTYDSPVLFLARLLALKAVKQGKQTKVQLMDSDLCNQILINDIVFKVVSVDTEVPIKNGNIDLIIYCKYKNRIHPTDEKRLRILIENKVNIGEHDEQCQKYYDYCSNKNLVENQQTDDVYVFLSIDEPDTLSCEHFIKITYQELLDSVLTLIQKQGNCYPESSVRYLQDFIDTITSLNTYGKRNIAMDSKTKKLLKDFYENNKDLIAAAILEGSDDEELKKGVIAYQNRTRLYKLSYKGNVVSVAMSNVAFAAIQMLRDVDKKAPAEIEKALNGIGKFWEKVEAGKEPTAGYTAEVSFDNGETYLVHTQRYKSTTDTFNNLIKKLEGLGFSCEQIC